MKKKKKKTVTNRAVHSVAKRLYLASLLHCDARGATTRGAHYMKMESSRQGRRHSFCISSNSRYASMPATSLAYPAHYIREDSLVHSSEGCATAPKTSSVPLLEPLPYGSLPLLPLFHGCRGDGICLLA